MPRSTNLSVATMGIDIGKNSLHVVGLDNADFEGKSHHSKSRRDGPSASDFS
jgi:hypothetical protein